VRKVVAAVLGISIGASLTVSPLDAQSLSMNSYGSANGVFAGARIGLGHGRSASATGWSGGVGVHAGWTHPVYYSPPSWYGYTCADVWGILDGPYYGPYNAGFFDDWFYYGDLYTNCVLRGPRWVYDRYHVYRSGYRPVRRAPLINISINIGRPYYGPWGPWGNYDNWGRYDPWGPYYGYNPWGYDAYDPWAPHTLGWIVYAQPRVPRVRTVFVPLAPLRPNVFGPTFKEDPRGQAVRRTAAPAPSNDAAPRGAAPRPSATPVSAAPRGSEGIQAPPRRAQGSGASGDVRGGEASTPPPVSTPNPSDAPARRGGQVVAPGPDGFSRPAAPDAATPTDRESPRGGQTPRVGAPTNTRGPGVTTVPDTRNDEPRSPSPSTRPRGETTPPDPRTTGTVFGPRAGTDARTPTSRTQPEARPSNPGEVETLRNPADGAGQTWRNAPQTRSTAQPTAPQESRPTYQPPAEPSRTSAQGDRSQDSGRPTYQAPAPQSRPSQPTRGQVTGPAYQPPPQTRSAPTESAPNRAAQPSGRPEAQSSPPPQSQSAPTQRQSSPPPQRQSAPPQRQAAPAESPRGGAVVAPAPSRTPAPSSGGSTPPIRRLPPGGDSELLR
jgi:hypothetical protein